MTSVCSSARRSAALPIPVWGAVARLDARWRCGVKKQQDDKALPVVREYDFLTYVCAYMRLPIFRHEKLIVDGNISNFLFKKKKEKQLPNI